MNFDSTQYYPTPEWLRVKLWGQFKTSIKRLLDPCAGQAELLMNDGSLRINPNITDVAEIDFGRRTHLLGLKLNVVSHDFMDMKGGAMYSHIIMNAPFAQGAEFVLHAWDILHSGEISALINAETLINPCTAKRKALLSLIEEHGSVEYIEDAFNRGGEERTADVDVALIYLRKTAECVDLLSGLSAENINVIGTQKHNDVLVSEGRIKQIVTSFNMATDALRNAATSLAVSSRFALHLDRSLVDGSYSNEVLAHTKFDDISKAVSDFYNAEYMKLKERAWTTLLNSSEVCSRITSNIQKSLEADFETMKKLEFTEKNIFSFFDGIFARTEAIQMEMMCTVFDMFTKYSEKNFHIYRGWKSNTKHKIYAFKLQTTRFILPVRISSAGNIDYSEMHWIRDIDKCFMMLDGKDYLRSKDDHTLVENLLTNNLLELFSGNRLTSEYFDIRAYPGSGTIHFFPKSKKLVDMLNQIVGKHRNWIPRDYQPDSDAAMGFEHAADIDVSLNDCGRSRYVTRKVLLLLKASTAGVDSMDKFDRIEYEEMINALDDRYTAAATSFFASLPASRRQAQLGMDSLETPNLV